MVKPQQVGKNVRMSFSKTDDVLEIPNLLEIQKNSYRWFLDQGLMDVLEDVSPITDYSGNLIIEFVGYSLDSAPKYPVEECKERVVTYAAPLRVDVRLSNKLTGEVKQSPIFMGDFPIMTDKGTFVINGAERVIVSQIVRSPGMYYDSTVDKTGKKIYTATVIPYRGAWLEYETDSADVFYVRIDKNRKLPVTVLIRALGVETPEQIEAMFGTDPKITETLERDPCEKQAIENNCSIRDEALKEIYKKLRPGEPAIVESAEILMNNLFFDPKRYDLAPVGRHKFDKKVALGKRIEGHTLAAPAVSPITGEVVFDAGVLLTAEDALKIEHAGVNEVTLLVEGDREVRVFSNGAVEPEYVFGYDLKDCGVNERARLSVMLEIKEQCGDDVEAVKAEAKRRIAELCPKHITVEDILASINYLIALSHDVGTIDDIDHLGNRRLRCVGELLQNQLRIGLARMDKIVKERMTVQDNETLTPQTLINIRPVVTAIREFFGSSPLSQFMDQHNPLAELTHKRRISALGPGGLSRDRASFEVRDVHYTHYGRMCPIETPEGPNIGLISYLSTYARISEYGFIEAPYRKVVHEKTKKGEVRHRVTTEIEYMTADVEDNYVVAQANEPLDENHCFKNRKVTARDKAEIVQVDPSEVDYMDVSPKMVVSAATAMIPFLENDDNSRALMGSNMQKQAVPLLMTDAPIVGTGMEYKVAVDSGVVVLAKHAGWVETVTADEIVINCEDGTRDTYQLIKFKRSNQGTCVNQRPIVTQGEQVKEGQVIADGPSTSEGEIALGKNALVGFMTWEGYNYEDAVLLNERLVRDDVYTSIHIEEYSHEARDTKLGPEEITREIPNVGDDALKDLDADGIVRKGTEVRAGDILVGKVTPKGETELTAEERLLRAIFGEKSREVRDTSLKVPHGENGIVVDVQIFSRENGDELSPGVNKVVRVYIAQKRKISVGDKMAGRHGNKGVVSRILPPEDMPFLPDGTPLDIVLNPLGVPSRMNIGQVLEVHLGIAAKRLGWRVMTPVFDGATERDILDCLRDAGLDREVLPGENLNGKDIFEETFDKKGNRTLRPIEGDEREDADKIEKLREEGKLRVVDGKTILYDGRTGEPFDNPVTVGIMYYLKLHHLVDDKIHARSTGPYSLVTQQPLGGKAQFGGQRFGEMEVWALEAYGAAYTLQEILTVKSDDVTGRVKTYEAIVKGQNIPTPGVPESFKVLVKELQSLALDIRVLGDDGEEIEISSIGEDDWEPAKSGSDRVTEEDVGSTVATNDLYDSFTDQDFDSDADSRKGDPGFDDDDVGEDDGIGDVLDEVFDADDAIEDFGMDDEEF
ncbi:MAG: DNA-directed RNA polymerase subunit beta [Clostridia bacterium]|nr:DNA-directed RNA polymerase subunit beta [Clostridia bacterium]